MQKTLLLLPLFTVACSYPRFVATKTVELDVPLAEAAMLDCTTHNGSITILPSAASDSIHVRAQIQVRGYTQEEAEDTLRLLSVGQDHTGETLKIFGDYPRSEMHNRSPSFSFNMEVPEHLEISLVTHNGDITTKGTTGAVRLETHNGSIDAATSSNKTRAETHNGSIKLDLQSGDELDGSVISHNGSISIAVSNEASCWLEIATHNGSIDPPSTIQDANIKRRSVRGRLGERATNGRLQVTTHNGNVVVRDGSAASKNELK